MDEGKIIQHFEGKTIFITGAPGFLTKIFIEKILRVQPNVKKLFLLIRPTEQRSIGQRLQEEVVDTELFRVLKEKWGDDFKLIVSSKTVPVSGDVSLENLGITCSELKEEMWREIDIIVNSAATTNFDERYDVAFATNVLGTKHVQEFARRCSKLDMLLHVSTAYVHGTRAGLILETPYHMGDTLEGSEIAYLDLDEEKKVIEERLKELQALNPTKKEITEAMKDLGIERAKLHGWPNTYVFTKAMGEMMLENFKEKANVVIIRPTIITSTYTDPFPGWMEGLRTMDSVFLAYGKGKLNFFIGDPNATMDVIPGDMVVNCMIAVIAVHSNNNDSKQDLCIYHVGSSRRNLVKYEELRCFMYDYLTKINPMLDAEGKRIRVRDVIVLDTMASLYKYIKIHYLPFFMVLQFLNFIFCNLFEPYYTNERRKINHVIRLAELYNAYLFSKAIFADDNTEHLEMRIRGSNDNMNVLNFDPKSIEWEDYFLNTHFPGLVKYVLK